MNLKSEENIIKLKWPVWTLPSGLPPDAFACWLLPCNMTRNAVHTLETVQVALGRTVVVIEVTVIPRLFKEKTTWNGDAYGMEWVWTSSLTCSLEYFPSQHKFEWLSWVTTTGQGHGMVCLGRPWRRGQHQLSSYTFKLRGVFVDRVSVTRATNIISAECDIQCKSSRSVTVDLPATGCPGGEASEPLWCHHQQLLKGLPGRLGVSG